MLKHNKNPIEQAFNIWINNYPESYHPLDMQRFYVLVKTVCRYSRSLKDGEWLKNKISEVKNSLSDEDVEFYCERFDMLQKFHKANVIPVYDIMG